MTLKVRRADRFPTETATVTATREPAAVAGTAQLQTATPPENVPVAASGLRSARAEQRTVPEACVETAILATSGLPTAARPRPKYVMRSGAARAAGLDPGLETGLCVVGGGTVGFSFGTTESGGSEDGPPTSCSSE